MKQGGSSGDFAQGIAVVISTYNRPHALNLVLQSLAEQSVPADQIIVGDDGSTRETADLIKGWNQRGLTVEHVWHADQGYRKTIAMNEAICRVRYSTTLFIDGDCIAHPNLVAHHKAYSEPGAILAGARILASKNFTEELERGCVHDQPRHLRSFREEPECTRRDPPEDARRDSERDRGA